MRPGNPETAWPVECDLWSSSYREAVTDTGSLKLIDVNHLPTEYLPLMFELVISGPQAMTWLHLLKKLLCLYCHDTKYILFKMALYCNNWFVFFFWCFSLTRSNFLKSGTIKGGSMPYHPGPLVFCKLILIQFCSYNFVILYSPTQSYEILALFNLGRVIKYLLCAKKWATHYTNQNEWETKMNSMSKFHNLVGDTIKQHKLYMASARRYVYTVLCGKRTSIQLRTQKQRSQWRVAMRCFKDEEMMGLCLKEK